MGFDHVVEIKCLSINPRAFIHLIDYKTIPASKGKPLGNMVIEKNL